MLRHYFLIMCCLIRFAVIAEPSPFDQRVSQSIEIDDYNLAIEALKSLEGNSLSTSEQSLLNLSYADVAIRHGQIQDALAYALQASRYAQSQRLLEDVAKANKLEAVTYYYLGDYDKAIDGYQATLVHYRMVNDYVQQANLLNNIGLANIRVAEYDNALVAYSEAQSLYQQYGSVEDQIDIKHNLAVLYISLRQYDNAIAHYEEVLQWHKANSSQAQIMHIYGEYSVPLKLAQQYQRALEYGLLAVEYYRDTNNPYALASALHNASEVHFELENYQAAGELAGQAITMAREIGHQKALSGALYTLAKTRFVFQDTEQAIEYLSQAQAIATEANDQALELPIRWLFAMLHANQGNNREALDAMQIAINQQNKLNNISLNTKLARYQSKMLAQEVNQLKHAKALEELRAKQVFEYWVAVVICLVLFGFLSFVLYRRNVERRANSLLTQKMLERTKQIEELNRELSLSSQSKVNQ
ncbi:tetratricopeptide repeat protein [Thalassotalea sp. LPB0316]|uniref:tetratricopeptide repeat protein n=1 Tax=Thalassotalea sp. LPB0316 TaxID=2769490 RepID=UPI00186768B5|nr:tetratricopeptide repeat protein [Thalassotalea sp. LPB0316]QOL25345.1 tetratricopeptide repeat protein [Thalassotalea sp. LPB0316]